MNVLLKLNALILLFGMSSVCTANQKDDFFRNFWSPEYHAQRLAYCTFDGKECGLPVATRFCRMLGYQKADKAIIAHNVGLTHYIATKGECKGWRCNGFKLIRCVGNASKSSPELYAYRYRRFVFPRMANYRIAWCYKNEKQCGKQTANSFCRRMGYLKATEYEKQENVPATKALGNHKLCFGKNCSGFKRIICYR